VELIAPWPRPNGQRAKARRQMIAMSRDHLAKVQAPASGTRQYKICAPIHSKMLPYLAGF